MAWYNLKQVARDFKRREQESEAISERMRTVFSASSGVADADPDEVEARLRNLSHGTYREG